MQQDFTGGIAELKQPKTEIQDYAEEKIWLNSLQVIKKENGTSDHILIKEEIDTYDHILIKEEIDSNFIQPEADAEKSVLQHFEEEGVIVNNDSFPIIQEANLFDQPNRHESGKQLQAIELNTEGTNSNAESNNENEINFYMQHSEENENRTSLIEGEKNCNMQQSEQQAQQSEQQALHSQEISSTKDFNYSSEQPETAKESIECSGQQQGNLDSITKTNFENVEESRSELQINDVAHCDLETTVEKNTILDQKTLKGITCAAKKSKAAMDKCENSNYLSIAEKHKFLEIVRKQIVQRENLHDIPLPIWNSLTRLSKNERKVFVRVMKNEFVMKQFPGQAPKNQGEACAVNEMTTRKYYINNLVRSFLQWLAEHWETAGKNFLNGTNNTKPKSMRKIRKMIYAEKLDPDNLPPKVWNSMKQMNMDEKNKFVQDVKTYIAKRLAATQKAQARTISESFALPSIATPKENSRKYNLRSRSRIHTDSTTNNKESANIPFYTYSFEKDFQSQKCNAGTLNIATTSKVSPSIFPGVFLSGCSRTQIAKNSSLEGNSFKNDYKSCLSHTSNSQNIEDTTSSGFVNVFSNNKSFTEGTNNQPSYRTPSYNLHYPDSDVNVLPLSSSNTSRLTGDSPFRSTYPNEFTMQSSYSRGAADSNQAVHSSSRYNLKRKRPDEVASYVEPNLKQFHTSPKTLCHNTNDDSIKVAIADNGSPGGTMNEERASLLTSQLVHLLDKASLQSRGQIPRFYNSGLSNGIFTVRCADQTSYDWLRNVVSKLPQLWRRADLHVRHFSQYSARRVQVNVFIPSPVEDSVTTLARLERQNPGLNTRTWEVCYQSGSSRGKVLYLEIDELSLQVLKNMNFKAFLGLSCITFQLSENTQANKRKPNHY